MWKLTLISFIFIYSTDSLAEYAPNLNELIDRAIEQNHLVRASAEDSRAEKKLVTSKYNLPDPAIGVANLNRGNETEYITIQQKIRFPVKYWLEGKAQKRLYESSQDQLLFRKLRLREKVISLYYEIYSVQKTIELTRTNLQIIRDFSRVAEKKYASGKSSQSDSMKAHFEMTQLEIVLLKLEQDEIGLQSQFKELVSDSNLSDLKLAGKNLAPPIVDMSKISKFDIQLEKFISENSPELKGQEKKLEAARYREDLAKWEFAPDFNLQYQQRISGAPEDSKIYSVNISFPLWFWKNSAEASHASAKALAENYRYKDMTMKRVVQFKTLKARIEKVNKILLIYKTTLMPQAEGAYRSTRSGYVSGRTSFLNLLDSERSLYQVQQNYYKSLTEFVQSVTEMESLIGQSTSNLYGIKGVLL